MVSKRLVFCTYPSVYSSLVLTRLLAQPTIQVCGIVCSTRVLSTRFGPIRAALEQIRLSGWRYSTYLFMVTDFYHLLSSSLLASRKNRLKSVFQLASEKNIPLLQTNDINQSDSVAFIDHSDPDVLLAAHFNQKINQPLLNKAGMQCLNIHPSLLPDYKGVDPVFHAMLNSKSSFGVTLHNMVEAFDSGTILGRRSLRREGVESVFEMNCKLFERGADLASKYISAQVANDLDQQGAGRYDSWPVADQIRQFRRQGNRLIRMSEYFSRLLTR